MDVPVALELAYFVEACEPVYFELRGTTRPVRHLMALVEECPQDLFHSLWVAATTGPVQQVHMVTSCKT